MTKKEDRFTPSELEVIAAQAVEIRETGCQSFIEVALRLPERWSTLRHGRESRTLIATLLAWPQTLEAQEIGRLSPLEIGSRLLNIGCDSAAELWLQAPRTCNALHLAGKLGPAIEAIGLNSPAPSEEGDPPLSDAALRCYGTIEAWFRFDFDRFRTAIRDGTFGRIAATFPPQPRQGWPTAGGRVHGMARLIVARILEVHGIPFEVGGTIPDINARKALPAPAFFLPVHRLALGFGDPGPVPQGHDTDAGAAAIRYVVVDDSLPGSAGGSIAFIHHVILTLEDGGVDLPACDTGSTYADLMCPADPSARPGR